MCATWSWATGQSIIISQDPEQHFSRSRSSWLHSSRAPQVWHCPHQLEMYRMSVSGQTADRYRISQVLTSQSQPLFCR